MKIAIRVDASPSIGTGHVMRCLTLADMFLANRDSVRFVARHMPDVLSQLIESRGHSILVLPGRPAEKTRPAGALTHAEWLGVDQLQDAADTREALAGDGCHDLLVVDHYALDECWERQVRSCAKRLFVIDDLADRRHDCDVLLDQNQYDDMGTRYTHLVPPSCQLLLGSRYALLRAEFAELRRKIRARDGEVRRLLVFFGGVDAGNVTSVTLDALDSLDTSALEIDVVIGSGHPGREGVLSRCAEQGIRCHVQTARMAELMAAADLAIGAGGTATWERCALGLPSIVLCLAENQRRLVRDAGRSGLVYAPDIGLNDSTALATHLQALLSNSSLRRLISQNGMQAVDGFGASRVAGLLGLNSVEVRPATSDDSANLLAWRNAPNVRAVSHNTNPIDESSHREWLAKVLTDPRRQLLIGSSDSEPVGVVRFDLSGTEAEVSIYLAPGLPGKGRGSALLLAAENWLKSHYPGITAIHAQVLGDNLPSHRLFNQCGYSASTTSYLKHI